MLLGCGGDFEIIVDGGNSKVNILYEIKIIKEENLPTNIIFKTILNGKEYKANSLKKLFEQINYKGILKINEKKQEKYKIYWEWPYENYFEDGRLNEEKDKIDTENARLNLEYNFEVEIVGVQSK